MITSLDHIGIAVRDLDVSLELYMNIFNITDVHRETVEEQGVHIASFMVGNVRIELTAPVNETSPITKFLNTRGEGVHHLAFRSDALEDDLARLSDNNIRLINKDPVYGAHEMLIAFLHPTSTGGVLMELCTHSTRR
ncbi:MAG: methylmalonyl-CoA epimerase [Ignavibacteria bacterium]|nr:methylmalonyl-CoA epimerase [Ignavibacteria bacterium]